MSPESLPALQITLGNMSLAEGVQVVSARISRAFSTPAMAEIMIEGPIDTPALGTPVRIEGLGPVFAGKIAALERARRGDARPALTLRAYDALQDLRLTGRAEAKSDVTPGAIAEEIAQRLGVGFDATYGGPKLAHVVRTARSDFDFLLSETRRVGLWFYLSEGKLQLTGFEGRGETRRVVLDEETLDARIEANGAQSTGAITFAGVAPATLEMFPGFSFGLDEARGFRANSMTPDYDLPMFNLMAGSSDEALSIAASEIAHRDAARVVLRAMFDGPLAPTLAQPLEILGAGVDLPGPLTVARVEHRLDAVAGHVAEVSTAPPPLRDEAAATLSFWGVVEDNADPINAGRVRCKLPHFGDVETSWLQVTRIMAGPGRGFASVPAKGDHVLIHSPSGRPEHGVVLGALTGREQLALQTGDARQFGFVSAEGHRLAFDDDRREAELSVPDGSRCRLGPDGIAIRAEGDLVLEAPGGRVTIRGDRIDFDRG